MRLVLTVALAVLFALAEVADAGAPALSYARDVAPLLDRYCRHCHSAVDAHGGLDLDGYEAVMRGGDSGPAVIPGDPAGSLLIAKVERRDRPAMPPRRSLRRSAIATLRAWIAAGAQP